jgi:SNF2 family DNA or RNA helicase
MSILEDIVSESIVDGLTVKGQAYIIATKWYGSNVLEVTFKDEKGKVHNQLLYRHDEDHISVNNQKRPWSFDADGETLRLVSEAKRIQLAHLFDPYLAVHTSSVTPLPHQITAVYEEMLPRMPLRFVLADDPGAGKTIMTGLLIKEMIVRGDLKRCLIVSPGNLTQQWQDELLEKFHLHFEIITNEMVESSASGNVFNEHDFCIARLDKLSRNDEIKEKLKLTEWDLVVCDEAHKMSATIFGGEVKQTKRYQLGKLLSEQARNFLLLTATPHNGKEEDFQLFFALIDPDRFEGVKRNSHQSIDVSDVMRRLVKEDLLKFDGTPLFPERVAETVNYDLSPKEEELYGAVTHYVQEEFNRAEKLDSNKGKNSVGFALTILQRRLASSPEAIYQSLQRRRERLEKRLSEIRMGKKFFESSLDSEWIDPNDDDFDDAPSNEIEEAEENAVDRASAARTMEELEAEIITLKKLEKLANDVRTSGEDRKWDELSKLLQDGSHIFDRNGQREKIIIFTEHRDTLNYLQSKISSLLGSEQSVTTIHGGMLRDERRKSESIFKEDKDVMVLIATDAAGEGINLQRAHLMVNYDLPWNPNRLEQRFGRIHRIGQTEVCYLWNLVSKETREGMVFQRLFEKLEEERNALGGKVFDILGRVTFDNKPLRELLIEAIRYGNNPDVRARLHQVVDDSLDTNSIKKLLRERALTNDVMDASTVFSIREEMERLETRKLQPNFIRAFFIEAFTKLGGNIVKRELDRYEILSVPVLIRERDSQIGTREPVLRRYERICFDKENMEVEGYKPATLIAPGHPLMNAVIDLTIEKNSDVMKRGSILVDDLDYGVEPRLLFYVESSICDGTTTASGEKRTISRIVHFVEINEKEESIDAGYAPYLNYRALKENETETGHEILSKQNWLKSNLDEIANEYSIENIVGNHLLEVKKRTVARIDKTEFAVKTRLTEEIQYWDNRANELRMKEQSGRGNPHLNSDNAQRKADELSIRLTKRLSRLEEEKKIIALPPVILGCSFIIPRGLIELYLGKDVSLFAHETKEIEMIAMNRVLKIERELGFTPIDRTKENLGYDIESSIPTELRSGSNCLRFIEVKGRRTGAGQVTVSKNEILTCLNKPNEFILAIVEVDGTKTHTVYLKKPFVESVDFTVNSVNYDIAKLKETTEILLERFDNE